MTHPRQLAYLALTFNALIWGAAFPIIKPAFAYITSLQYLYFRFLVAGIIGLPLFVYFYIKKHPKISYSLKVLIIETLGITLPLPLLYKGLELTSALEASLLGSIGPIFVVLGGIWFLGERESKREWLGLGLSLFGSLLLVAEPYLTGISIDTASSAWGNLLVLGYNLLYTCYVLLAKRIYRTRPPLYFGAAAYLVSTLIFGLMLSIQGSLPSLVLLTNPTVLLPVLYMAVPGGILAFSLYLYAQSKIEVSEANLFTYLNGVVAIPASYLLLGEVPSFVALLAIIIITVGVIFAERHH